MAYNNVQNGVNPAEADDAGRFGHSDRAGFVQQKSVDALSKLRELLKERGCHGIVSLGRRFRAMDDDGSKTLSYEEFSKAMRELTLVPSEIQALFRYFDGDCNGTITYDEFLTGLRGELNDRRKALVGLAYGVMDKNGDGQVDMKDVVDRYDVSQHPDVKSGLKSKIQVLREFLDVFDCEEKDGIITPSEFYRYYAGVSAAIDDDDYFELMIRNAWHISGGEGAYENTTCRRVLVTHADGHQSVEEITNDFDIAKDDIEGMKANLKARGIEAVAIDVMGDAAQAPSSGGATPASPDSQSQVNKTQALNIRAKNMQSSIIF